MTDVAVVSSDLLRLRGLLTATGPAMELRSPVTGEVLGELPTSTPADVEVGAQLAHRAQPEWAARPIDERARLLLDFHDHLLDRRDYFVDLLQSFGKDRLSAANEVLHVALTARYYGRTARRYLRSERGEGILPLLTRVDRHYVPKGLVGVIGPWNYPLLQLSWKIAPALAAGCSVVVKPAEDASLATLRLADLLAEAGVPDGAFNVVPGLGPEAGAALAAHTGIDKITFTGSPAVGKTITSLAGEKFRKVTLELGGKAPQLIFPDADLDASLPWIAMGNFYHQGQVCAAGTRVIVHESMADQVVEGLVEFARNAVVGDPFDPATGRLRDQWHGMSRTGTLGRLFGHVPWLREHIIGRARAIGTEVLPEHRRPRIRAGCRS